MNHLEHTSTINIVKPLKVSNKAKPMTVFIKKTGTRM